MTRILVPVDGSENAMRALKYVLDHRDNYPSLDLHLLNIQPVIVSGNVRLFVDQGTIHRYYEEESSAAMESARRMAESCGVPCTTSMRTGHAGEAITEYARENHCDQIVMGSRGLGLTAGLILGSVTTRTLQLATVPVTVVR